MFYIASTRFNNETHAANMAYRKKTGDQVIYGTNIRIQGKYDPGSLMFVIEMNNDENRIEGIGLIRNTLIFEKKHNIYENSDYNRYIYRGDYWLSRQQLEEIDAELVEICELISFKGKSHLKRLSGISVITKQLFTNWDYCFYKMKAKIRGAFIKVFKSNTNIISETNLKNLSDKEDEQEEL
jgi:hypothetical protein